MNNKLILECISINNNQLKIKLNSHAYWNTFTRIQYTLNDIYTSLLLLLLLGIKHTHTYTHNLHINYYYYA